MLESIAFYSLLAVVIGLPIGGIVWAVRYIQRTAPQPRPLAPAMPLKETDLFYRAKELR